MRVRRWEEDFSLGSARGGKHAPSAYARAPPGWAWGHPCRRASDFLRSLLQVRLLPCALDRRCLQYTTDDFSDSLLDHREVVTNNRLVFTRLVPEVRKWLARVCELREAVEVCLPLRFNRFLHRRLIGSAGRIGEIRG